MTFIFLLILNIHICILYSGMQEAKLYYSRIDKTNRLRYIASRFIFEFKHLNGIFLVLQTTLIFKFCLRIEITIHKSIASLKFNESVQIPMALFRFRCKTLSLDLRKIGRIYINTFNIMMNFWQFCKVFRSTTVSIVARIRPGSIRRHSNTFYKVKSHFH